MLVNRKELLEAVTHFERISRKCQQPYDDMILIEQSEGNIMNLYAGSGDKTLYVKAEISSRKAIHEKDKSINCSVFGKKLLRVVKTLSSDTVVVAQEDKKLLILDHPSIYKIDCFDLKEYTKNTYCDLASRDRFTVNGKLLLEGLSKTITSTASFETNNVLCGVNFRLNKDRLELAGTDGNRLFYQKIKLHKEFKSSFNVNIRKNTIENLIKILKPYQDKQIYVTQKDNCIQFNFGNYTIYSICLENRYPQYKKLIPNTNEQKAIFSKDALITQLKKLEACINSRTNAVKIGFIEEKSPDIVKIRANNLDETAETRILVDNKSYTKSFAVNYKFLLEGLAAIDSDKVIFEQAASPLSPLLLKNLNKNYDNSLFLIMPIQVK